MCNFFKVNLNASSSMTYTKIKKRFSKIKSDNYNKVNLSPAHSNFHYFDTRKKLFHLIFVDLCMHI